MKINFTLNAIIACLYVVILYLCGMTLNTLVYVALTPMLLAVFIIDYRKQIIPNRLTLTIFELGLIYTFISGISDLSIFVNNMLGLVTGAGIFLIITLIGGAIAGKEAMGFGDVKLMGAIGLIFGFSNIIMIAVIAFLLGAIISIILLASKKKKSNEYIPFGPFIILGTFLVMLMPHNLMLFILLKIFTLGMFSL